MDSAAEQDLQPAGAHLALPGLISGGTVRQAPNLGWSRVAVEGLFAQALSRLHRPGARDAPGAAHRPIPVTTGNEADVAALAELWFGALGKIRTFLYLTGDIGFDSLPLYVRENAVLPLGADEARPDGDWLTGLTLFVAPGTPGERTVTVPDHTGATAATYHVVRHGDGTVRALAGGQGARQPFRLSVAGRHTEGTGEIEVTHGHGAPACAPPPAIVRTPGP